MTQILGLYGIKALWIDYHVSYKKRDKIVAQFYQSNDARVMIFSNVGSNGLNLAIADIVIFFVSCAQCPFNLPC
jgi:SNF2 family DNA or RNA helicase